MQKTDTELENVMRKVRIHKVVVNIGVGKSGESVEKAKEVVKQLVGRNPTPRRARDTIREFGIRKGEPIGVSVTLRDDYAPEKLKIFLNVKENRLPQKSFDEHGNCSFGIKEHIEISGTRYDPGLGIFGLNVSTVLDRPGYRVGRRKRNRSKVGEKHRVNRDDAVLFFKETLGVEIY